jgi:hypothetical protein
VIFRTRLGFGVHRSSDVVLGKNVFPHGRQKNAVV